MWVDDALARHSLSMRTASVTAAGELTVDLAAAGGAYLKLAPATGGPAPRVPPILKKLGN